MLAELTVDLSAIRRNAAALAALIGSARLVPVIKANAYGHGLLPVGQALAPSVTRLAVYEVSEACALRAAGLTLPIHVLGPIAPRDLDEALAANADITLWDDGAYLRDVARAAQRPARPLRAHAKIDTGVTRLGMHANRAPTLLAQYARTPASITLVGAFSHLAAAEELHSTFTHEQLATFERATADLAPTVERHIAASAAAMLWPETRLDAVRAGIAIYGCWPSAQTATIMRERGFVLEQALSWRTQIVIVHDVPAHTPVGYGCSFHTKRPSRIGVIPIGYAEGLPRSAGDRAHVLVAGTRVRIVGRVCMNMAFVDLTDVPDAHSGTTVTLIGRDGSDELAADELANACGTINYEIIARLPAHVPRVYVGGEP